MGFGHSSWEAPLLGNPKDVDAQQTAISEIRASGLFNSEWYLRNNPDVAEAGVDPLVHYVTAGAAEGRTPGPEFDVLWYLGECPEAGAPGVNPILHYIRFGRGMGCTPTALSEGQAFDSFLAASRAGTLPFAGDLRSTLDNVHYTFQTKDPIEGAIAFPPLDLVVRIGSPSIEGFEHIGSGVKQTISRCLPSDFNFRGSRCLDFGCGIGRVIRHFHTEARTAEFWGCDIDGTSIRWAVENMTPPFRFYQMSQAPSLPFEDSSFDLIYAVGVFSQVFEDWHHWAVEIRRILKPGGTFFMSYAGQAPFEEMLSLPYDGFAQHPGLYVKNPFNSWNRGGPMVFMSPVWVERHWGSLFDIDFIAPDALLDYQSICVMRKPQRGAPPQMGARIAEIATRQSFNPNAVGRIWAQCDLSRPFLESYGIETSGETQMSGWIVLRDDQATNLSVTLGETLIESTTRWETHARYRDWPNAFQTVFHTRFVTSSIPHGRYTLSVCIVGERGTVHKMAIPLKVN